MLTHFLVRLYERLAFAHTAGPPLNKLMFYIIFHVKRFAEADRTDKLPLPAGTPVQIESQLRSMKQAARSIGLHVNAYRVHALETRRSR